jgi:hypothetical protein
MRFLRFLSGLFIPRPREDYYLARLALKADLAWQPYLHTTIFWGVIFTVAFGDPQFIPPEDIFDYIWIFGGIAGPLVGIRAVWMMKHSRYTGEDRYRAFWMRLSSDIMLASTISAFEIERLCVLPFTPPCKAGEPCGIGFEPFVDTVLLGALAFLLVLIIRDIKFLIITERIADELRKRGARGVPE